MNEWVAAVIVATETGVAIGSTIVFAYSRRKSQLLDTALAGLDEADTMIRGLSERLSKHEPVRELVPLPSFVSQFPRATVDAPGERIGGPS